jgi:hypothetical protein
MENLFDKDSTFELNSSMNGNDILNANRVLMSYPSEKSSFQVFLGADGQFEDLYFEGTEPTPTEGKKVDPEKLAQSITAGASALGSVASTVQAFKGDGSKAPSRRKQLKEVCGRRPISAKKREGAYNKCVEQYNANKIGGGSPQPTKSLTDSTPKEEDEKPSVFNTKNIVIGLVIVGVVATAFIGYKKGWFTKKG